MTRQDFLEFESVFVERDAPKSKSMCKVSSIERIHINTDGDDTENAGDYYVWLDLSNGDQIPCFAGTLSECQAKYEHIKSIASLDITEA